MIENNILVDILAYLILIAISVAMIGQVRGRYMICTVLTAVLVLLYFRDLKDTAAKLAGLVLKKKDGN